jgi:hypothetical protein
MKTKTVVLWCTLEKCISLSWRVAGYLNTCTRTHSVRPALVCFRRQEVLEALKEHERSLAHIKTSPESLWPFSRFPTPRHKVVKIWGCFMNWFLFFFWGLPLDSGRHLYQQPGSILSKCLYIFQHSRGVLEHKSKDVFCQLHINT